MFFNISNHPSFRWDAEQREAASAYGKIIDVIFPNVAPAATLTDVNDLMSKVVKQVIDQVTDHTEPIVAMVQGEFTLATAIVRELQAANVKCVAACSERNVKDLGNGQKVATFQFVQFREYPNLATHYTVEYK